MRASTLQQYRLPTGELVIASSQADEGFSELLSSFLKGEMMCFAVTLLSCFSTLWVLAG